MRDVKNLKSDRDAIETTKNVTMSSISTRRHGRLESLPKVIVITVTTMAKWPMSSGKFPQIHLCDKTISINKSCPPDAPVCKTN